MVCDAKGRPLRFALTGGQAADAPEATPLLDGIETGSVIADKGYEPVFPIWLKQVMR